MCWGPIMIHMLSFGRVIVWPDLLDTLVKHILVLIEMNMFKHLQLFM